MPARLTVDINCDMGEGFGAWMIGEAGDEALLPFISSSNAAGVSSRGSGSWASQRQNLASAASSRRPRGGRGSAADHSRCIVSLPSRPGAAGYEPESTTVSLSWSLWTRHGRRTPNVRPGCSRSGTHCMPDASDHGRVAGDWVQRSAAGQCTWRTIGSRSQIRPACAASTNCPGVPWPSGTMPASPSFTPACCSLLHQRLRTLL